MFALRRFLNTNSLSKGCLTTKTGVRTIFKLDFNSKEEIVENYFDNIMLIGINLPDSRNVLTESAVLKLKDSLRHFENNDEFTSAVICGFGGTFCTGVANEETALKESQKLIEALHKGKKPVIAAINGYAINFGFHLALMCDIRVMEDESMAGFGSLNQRSYVPDVVYQRLALSIGISRASELILSQSTRNTKYLFDAGFCTKTSCGTGFGQAIALATSIGQKPLQEVIEEKHKIMPVLPRTV